MTINVKSLTNIVFEVKVYGTNTIDTVRTEVLRQAQNIPIGLVLFLIYGGKILEMERTLQFYNIQNTSTLHMVLTHAIKPLAIT